MRVERLRVLPNLLTVVLIMAASFGTAYADTRPYFKVFGGDVMSGGNYSNASTCNTSPSSNYQDPMTNPTDDRRGGILTFVDNAHGGAASQYAAYSIGQIETNNGSNYGFYSGGDLSSVTRLTFANTSGGGLFDGGQRQASSCIPDYFSRRGTDQPLPMNADQIHVKTASVGNGKYYFKPDPSAAAVVISSNLNINPGQQTTIYIDGSVIIDTNINFVGNGNYNVDQIPKFSLVAKGDIFISKNVTNLDGVYIAQPGTATAAAPNTGTLWTCTDPANQANNKDSLWLYANCQSQLVVNGAIIAQQVNFTRVKGDATAAAGGEDAACASATNSRAINASCANIAEIINYVPEVVLGGPTIGASGGSSGGSPTSSIKSLPPVY